MVKFCFRFTEDEVALIFTGLILLRQNCGCHELRDNVDELICSHELYDFANMGDSDG